MRMGVQDTSPPHIAFHSVTWIVWLCASLIAATTTRNPFYLLLLFLCLLIVFATVEARVKSGATPLLVSPIKFTLFVTTTSALFNMITTHYGSTILFALPTILPLIGGNITLEAWAYGMTNGLIISCLFAAFTVLNMVLPVRSIVRFIPRAFYPLAIVISIAVTFVPTTLRQFQLIREAQAVRGHRLRGVRDWLPLFLPLLIGGLERALLLAEAMTARGFAGNAPMRYNSLLRGSIVVGLALLLAGWLMRLGWGMHLAGRSLMVVGAALILGVLWLAGRQTRHTIYRRERWHSRDAGVIMGSVMIILVFLTIVPGTTRSLLFYSPYPLLRVPPFEPIVGAVLMCLLVPAILLLRQEQRRAKIHHDTV